MKQTQFRVGDSKYHVHYIDESRGKLLGRINYGVKSIEVFTKNRKPHAINETVLHELTHAILHEMKHTLYNDERFVTRFASLLNNALSSGAGEVSDDNS